MSYPLLLLRVSAGSIPKTRVIKSQKSLKKPNMMPFNKENSLIVLLIQREIES